jgi:hypothetical protein
MNTTPNTPAQILTEKRDELYCGASGAILENPDM